MVLWPSGFLVITQYQSVRVRPELQGMNPASLPGLLKSVSALNSHETTEEIKLQNQKNELSKNPPHTLQIRPTPIQKTI